MKKQKCDDDKESDNLKVKPSMSDAEVKERMGFYDRDPCMECR
jgi:hypothetical protein